MKSSDGGAGAVQLRLGPELTVWNAADTKQQVVAALEEGPNLELDLSAVETADLTCLQLLCSAHRTVTRQGGQIRVLQVSEAFSELVESAGVRRTEGCAEGCLWVPGDGP